MAVTRLQHAHKEETATTVVNLTVSPTTAGSLIVAVCAWGTTTAGSCTVTDNKGGGSQTYLNAIGPVTGSIDVLQIMYAANSAAGTTQLTFTLTGVTSTSMDVFMVEYSALTATPLDQTASNKGTRITVYSSFFGSNVVQAGELIVAAVNQPGIGGLGDYTSVSDGHGDTLWLSP
jgi:hypothetical protein